MLFQFWIQSTSTQTFSKVGVHMKDKSKVQATVQHSTLAQLSHFRDGRYWERTWTSLWLLGADITQFLVHTWFSPQPAFLNSLGCQRRRLIFSCRTFWPEASLNGASFGLAFFYLLWDEQPANSADWHWAGTQSLLSLTLSLFSFHSTQLPLILCFYHSILLSQVQLPHFVSCSKLHGKCDSKY